MGRPYREVLEGDSIVKCKKCGIHLAYPRDIVSKVNGSFSQLFQGHTGRAYLYSKAYNLKIHDSTTRIMTTGLHVVQDVECISCQSILGWKYVKAYDADQKYKEGKWIIERAFTNDFENSPRANTSINETNNSPLSGISSSESYI